MTTLSTARILKMLTECERMALVVRVGIHGVRAGIAPGCSADQELRALHRVASDLQDELGRYIAEVNGEDYVAPSLDCELASPPSSSLN